MDSINKQQPEDNHENLLGTEAVDKINELANKAEICFFCTRINSGEPFAARPMAVQDIDDQGNLWFMSAKDSHKNAEIDEDPMVQLLFQGSDYSDFLSIYGRASISTDKEKIKELWKPMAKVWFTEGVNDPRITVIKVTPQEGYYWDTKHNHAIAFIKRIVGAAIGKTLDDSVEGKVEVSEA